jgi:hypothetical protein
MKRNKAVGAVLIAIILLGGYLLYGYLQEPAYASPDFSSWAPGPAAIRSKIGSLQTPAPGLSDGERRTRFCDMFKNRFRHHDPAIAVGLRFTAPTRIKLMCPARMEPCYMDEIALAAWHEARDNFGGPIDIDIYDTFIGTNQIKIGELRASAMTPNFAHVAYDFRALQVLNRPHRFQQIPGVRFRPVQMRSYPPGILQRLRPPTL